VAAKALDLIDTATRDSGDDGAEVQKRMFLICTYAAKIPVNIYSVQKRMSPHQKWRKPPQGTALEKVVRRFAYPPPK
jgi:hypothetical protein